DNEDLAGDSTTKLKMSWNKYLFDDVLPKAWARFLATLPEECPRIQPTKFYDFWPIFSGQDSSSIIKLCKELLKNVIENLKVDDEVFIGSPASYLPGNLQGLFPKSNKNYVKKDGEFRFLSIANGYFQSDVALNSTSEILGKIGFPVIVGINPIVMKELKESKHRSVLHFYSPKIIKTYLQQNQSRLENLSREEILDLLRY
ncbi:16328_t:CDS:2, partial [Acaulospora colombiana]